jgi:hypothetical protein
MDRYISLLLEKMMKAVLNEIVFVLTPFAVSCFFLYLVGSFISVSWNPADWTMDCRIICAVWAVTFGGGFLVKLEMMR